MIELVTENENEYICITTVTTSLYISLTKRLTTKNLQ